MPRKQKTRSAVAACGLMSLSMGCAPPEIEELAESRVAAGFVAAGLWQDTRMDISPSRR